MKILGQHQSYEKRRLIHSLILPLLFLFLMFTVRLVETLENVNLHFLGIKPLSIEGLTGILTMPFVHASWNHLWNNAPSFLILSVGLFYFYRPIGYKVFFTIYFLGGALLWMIARNSWHVGASGLIYGLSAFLFVSGIYRRYIPLLAIALLVVFLYGSLVWGLFPWHQFVTYSWEGHFWGAFAGIFAAVIYRKQGPQRPVIDIPDEPEDEAPYWELPEKQETQ
ncbi:MAG: rhomboid family intramembrane serine protease [Cytophagaceae bacterium]|jgi:membrane associated rhomboid family serine protease|nr:rhomboid family intramembrane serine protease [Cytophagaceae bacterium]